MLIHTLNTALEGYYGGKTWGSTKVTQSGELQGTMVTQIEYEGKTKVTRAFTSQILHGGRILR